MTVTQKNRAFRVESSLGSDDLLFQRMSGTEQLGQLFEFYVDVLSESHSIDLNKVLGESMTIVMEIDDKTTRYFNGIVTSFAQDGSVGDLARYRAVVRPWLWLLTRTSDCRIFQNQSVPEIVAEVMKQKGFTDVKKSLSGQYAKREYCVQYRETDFDFISRLLESEGIYYYFTHEKKKHTLVLSDSQSSHSKTTGYDKIPYYPLGGSNRRERDHIYDWSFSREVQPGTVAITDYDFEKPKADLKVKSAASRSHAQSKFEMFDYPGGFVETKNGENYAKARIESWQSQHEIVTGRGNARGIASGALFTLEKYPRSDQNREHLVISVTHELESDSYQTGGGGTAEPYKCTFRAIDSKQSFRLPFTTPRPTIYGPQTAVVVGKKNEDIWTDKYGRVKVQFHWDRYGKKDENSSCWVRVAQMWAGKKWGGIHIPRIGQEVVVEFLEGNPDRPLITGSVYNADQMPPYDLPTSMTQSGIKTRTTKQGNDKTFNELRFDDKKDKELVYMHAERDFERVVENNDTLKVGFDKKDKGDQVTQIYNNCQLTIEKGNRQVEIKELDDILTVTKGNQKVTVENDCTLDVKSGGRAVTIAGKDDVLTVSKGNLNNTVSQGDYSLKIDSGKCVIEAGTSITLKVGGSSIKIESSKISIKSNEVSVTGDSKAVLKGTKATVEASGDCTIKGSIVKIN
ncbi:MAG: type VI secretion system tip protein VgrG [Planctomycetales bacterium]|nr:type VI secretion system tip protein VgrG [Planctomycetales bacterium]